MSAAWPASSGTPVGTLLHKDSPRPGPPRPFAPSHEFAPRSSRASSGSCRIALRPTHSKQKTGLKTAIPCATP
jgi:hypothetical protein